MQSHLTDAQLSELRSALWERYTELREEVRQELLKQENEQFVELAGQVHDAEEESVASLLVDLNLATLDRHVQELNEVEAALVRMREGTYGICVDTGEPIPFERLQANPTAVRTFEAQSERERREPPPPTL